MDGLLINLREFKQFHHVDAAIADLASAEEVWRTTHDGRDLMLGKASLFPRRNESLRQQDPLLWVYNFRGRELRTKP